MALVVAVAQAVTRATAVGHTGKGLGGVGGAHAVWEAKEAGVLRQNVADTRMRQQEGMRMRQLERMRMQQLQQRIVVIIIIIIIIAASLQPFSYRSQLFVRSRNTVSFD